MHANESLEWTAAMMSPRRLIGAQKEVIQLSSLALWSSINLTGLRVGDGRHQHKQSDRCADRRGPTLTLGSLCLATAPLASCAEQRQQFGSICRRAPLSAGASICSRPVAGWAWRPSGAAALGPLGARPGLAARARNLFRVAGLGAGPRGRGRARAHVTSGQLSPDDDNCQLTTDNQRCPACH